ncbi:hypothetical protein DFH11DRAFT_314472 [Phellopilus nigrolimitatus]|nr:hypothetical protein DFH11DRAFT_1095013 [Phellopilus nigrolimitatus]KAH8113664.1 hypothetical protein DFH11DRAFT_314472 [Phellopilus nigrolimitatus]
MRPPSATAGSKVVGGVFPEPSSKQRKIEFADDLDFSTDEDGGRFGEAERTNREIAPSAADRRLAEAAAEAQRQRDLFAKVDRRSYTNLNRTNSGLLSSILHPDPTLLPADHPYRNSKSTQDILAQPGRPLYQPAPLQPSKSTTAIPIEINRTKLSPLSPEVISK